MKKIITLVLLVAVVVVLVFVLSANKVEGVWNCTYYAMRNELDNTWKDQGEQFSSMFQMKIYDDGRVVITTAGQESEGTYEVHKDTMKVTMLNSASNYVIKKDTLTLVDHPRAKIKYTRVGKIEGE